MADTQTMPTVREVLLWDAAKAQRWIAETQAQTRNDPQRFNWHGLAEIAAADASREASQLSKPRQRLPKEQQKALGQALSGEHFDPQSLSEAARVWLDAALPALNHARIAARTYHYLADREGPIMGDSFTNSAMTVRANMIRQLGPLPGDDILDPDRITDQFLADFPLTPSEAREQAAWTRQQLRESARSDRLVDTLRLLRRIKNALKPIALLVEEGTLQPSPILAEWLAVRDSLP